MDSWWQVCCSGCWELAVPYSNAIIFKRKHFLSVFCSIYGIYIKFQTFFVRRTSSYLMYFRNYKLSKTWLDHSPKSGVSEHPSTVNLLKGLLTPTKSAWENLCHIFASLSEKIILKIFPILKFEILGVFVNTLTANDKYAVQDSDSLQFAIQLQLSEKRKFFSSNFFSIYGIYIKFQTFSIKKRIVIANVFPKLPTIKDLVRPLSKKRRFRTSFDSQHVKGSQTLVKFAWEHFYQIFSSLRGEKVLKIFNLLKFEIIGLFVNTLTADYMYLVPDSENLSFPIPM